MQVFVERERGFTLVEIMIVVLVIAVLLAIAIPNMMRSRMAANEAACVGDLKTIATSEGVFARLVEVDQDNDGIGEHGWLAELCGEVCPRRDASSSNPRPAQPPYISPSFATGAGEGRGYAEHSGYLYRLYLCIADPTAEDDAGDDRSDTGTVSAWGTPLNVATDRSIISVQESSFCCHAWPIENHSTGQRAFAVNEVGSVYATRMTARSYTGEKAEMADYSANYSASSADGGTCFNDRFASGPNDLGNDGNTWNPAG